MLLNDIELRYVEGLSFLYPKRECENIFQYVVESKLGWGSCEVGDRIGQEISPEMEAYFLDVLEQLKSEKPLQYVLQSAHFYGYDFYVDSNVLIPRPETEELVYWVLQNNKGKSGKVLDVGSGSGCIPITIDKESDRLEVSSIDVSEGAISVANINNQDLGSNVDFKVLDVFSDAIYSRFCDLSVLVSNPPYITEKERDMILGNVLKYEPELALFAEGDALGFYRRISEVGTKILKRNGELYFECNEFNAHDVVDIMMSFGYQNVVLKQDLQGKDRMVMGIWP